MRTTLHFSNLKVPQETQDRIQNWIETFLGDSLTNIDLNIDLFCSRQGLNVSPPEEKYLCVGLVKARWMNSALTFRTTGVDCWDSISEFCHLLRQQLRRKKKANSNHRHQKIQLFKQSA